MKRSAPAITDDGEGMTSELLLGIDVGTTTCKAALITLDGEEIAHGARPTPWTPVPTGAEFDALILAEAARGVVLDALAAVSNGAVRGVGVTSMGEAGVLLDRHGTPLMRGIAWHDSRGAPESERIAREIGASEFVRHTALPIGPFWTIAKVAALRDQSGGTLRGHRWLSVAEWMVRWLGGEEVAELSLASRTGFLDVTTRDWWSTGLDWAGVSPTVMPPLVTAGTPAGRVSTIPELKEAVVTVAGHDQPCGAVGAGATGSGDTLDSCGTAEAILRAIPSPVAPDTIEAAAARGLTAGCHVLPGRSALLGFFKAGVGLKRFLRMLGADDVGERRTALDREALVVPEGAGGLVAEGIEDDVATLTGIGPEASPGALWRAAMEATARESARLVTSIDELAGRTQRLVVTGGWARSDAYRTVKRAVQGTFDHADVAEAGARGAALFGGLAAGVYGSVDEFPRPRSRSL